MHQGITHINNISPGYFRMFVAKFFCQKVGCLTNYHNVIDDCMKTHDVGFHVFE